MGASPGFTAFLTTSWAVTFVGNLLLALLLPGLLAREFLKRYAKRDILEAAKVGYSIAGQRRGGRVVVLRGRVSLPASPASMPGGSSLDGDQSYHAGRATACYRRRKHHHPHRSPLPPHPTFPLPVQIPRGFLIMSTSLQSYHSRRATAFYRRREHLRQILAVDFRISDASGDSILVCGRRAADRGKLAAFVQHGTVVPLASSKRIIGFLDTSWLEQEQQFLETHPNLQPSDLVISRGMVTEGQTVSVMGRLREARPLEDNGETIRSSSVWSTAQEGLVLTLLERRANGHGRADSERDGAAKRSKTSRGRRGDDSKQQHVVRGSGGAEGQTVSVMGLLREARPLEDDGETIRSSSVWSTAQEGLVLEPLCSPVNVGEFFLCWGFFPVYFPTWVSGLLISDNQGLF
ncbi:unnamed protein product [Closterium sp. NIES-64]|nr:unnamed protein product [Closterium sp. NIES-64]